MALNRRSLLQRAAVAAGLAVVETILPRGLDDAHAVESAEGGLLVSTPRRLIIMGCVLEQGDPSENDPSWIEEWGGDVIIRDRHLMIAGPLTLPASFSFTTVQGCLFRHVPLIVRGSGVRILDSHFIRDPNRSHPAIEFSAQRTELGSIQLSASPFKTSLSSATRADGR